MTLKISDKEKTHVFPRLNIITARDKPFRCVEAKSRQPAKIYGVVFLRGQVLAHLGLLSLMSTSFQDSSMSKWRCAALKVLAQEHVSYSQAARPCPRGLAIAGRLPSSSQTETSSLLALTFPFRRSIFPTKFHGRRNQRIPLHFPPVQYEG